jgi:hypothetical protein
MKKLCNLIRKYVTVGKVCGIVNILINCFAYACTFMLIYIYLYKDEYTWRNKYLFANKEDVVTTGLMAFALFIEIYFTCFVIRTFLIPIIKEIVELIKKKRSLEE